MNGGMAGSISTADDRPIADIGSQVSVETIAVLIRVSRYPVGAP